MDSVGPGDARRTLRAALLVIAAWAVLAVGWRLQVPVRWFALSMDDLFRTQHAIEVAAGELIPADLWPPLPFWLAGGLIWMGVPPWTAPGMVNFVATLMALALVADTVRALGLGARSMNAAVVLAASLPWVLWLAWSGLSEPIAMAAHAAVIRGLVAWRTPPGRWFILSGLVLGGLTRYEAWGDYVVILALAWTVRREVPWRWAWLPLVFPVAWLVFHTISMGDPLSFAATAQGLLAEDPDTPRGIAALGSVFLDVWQGADVVLLIGILGWWRMRGVARAALIFGVAGLAMQMIARLLDLAGTHTWQRHYVAHALFLAIGGGALLAEVRGAWLVAALTALLGVRVAASSYENPPLCVHPDLDSAITRLEPLLDSNPGAVLVELDDFSGFAVPILLGERKVVWDRGRVLGDADVDPRAGRSVLLGSYPTLRAWIRDENVGFLLTATVAGRARAGGVAREVYRAGMYSVFRVEPGEG